MWFTKHGSRKNCTLFIVQQLDPSTVRLSLFLFRLVSYYINDALDLPRSCRPRSRLWIHFSSQFCGQKNFTCLLPPFSITAQVFGTCSLQFCSLDAQAQSFPSSSFQRNVGSSSHSPCTCTGTLCSSRSSAITIDAASIGTCTGSVTLHFALHSCGQKNMTAFPVFGTLFRQFFPCEAQDAQPFPSSPLNRNPS